MEGSDARSLVDGCDLFSGFTADEVLPLLDDLGGFSRSFKKDEIIFLAGSEPTHFGIVLDGQVQLVRETVEGEQIIHDDLGHNATFGVSRAIAQTKSSPITIMASVSCRVLLIPSRTTSAPTFGQSQPQVLFLKNLMRVLARKNVRANRRMSYLYAQGLRAKLCRYLHFYRKYSGSNTFTIPFTRSELASFLAVNRSAMSRELSRMQEDGLIEFSKSTFTILGSLDCDS